MASELRKKVSSLQLLLRDYSNTTTQTRGKHRKLARAYQSAQAETVTIQRRANQLEQRNQALQEEVSTLREERRQLTEELAEARRELRQASVPELAALEAARETARQAQAEQNRLEHRLQSMQRDFDFTRAQYQTASAAAAESALEVMTLRDEVQQLQRQRQAGDEAVRLQQANLKTVTKRHDHQVGQLQQRVGHLESLLRDQQERRAQERAATRPEVGGARSRSSSSASASSLDPTAADYIPFFA